MNPEEIKALLLEVSPDAQFDETGEWMQVLVDGTAWKPLARFLRQPPMGMDYLFCLTCIDWKTHMTMVYHLTSTTDRQPIVIKAKIDAAAPRIETACDIWRTAEFHEREVYDLFGVHFTGHPDLRRLILEDDFVGYPLRKDFEDPVNMIKL